jgi:hypothetical protein
MKLPVFDDAPDGPASASQRQVSHAEESRGRQHTPSSKERSAQIPMPMMLISSALAGASRD